MEGLGKTYPNAINAVSQLAGELRILGASGLGLDVFLIKVIHLAKDFIIVIVVLAIFIHIARTSTVALLPRLILPGRGVVVSKSREAYGSGGFQGAQGREI